MVTEIEEILVNAVNKGAARQLIQRVKISARALKKALRNGGIDINDYWRLKYYFYRNYYNDKENKWRFDEIGKLIDDKYKDNIYKKIIDQNIYNKGAQYDLDLITIAARIAELKTKNKDKKKLNK